MNKSLELEVRFGTRGIRRLTKNDYDNVIKTLKSFGFKSINPNGEYSLRIQNEFLNNISGKFEVSNVRTEIYGIEQIKMFCNSNNIKELIKTHGNSVRFTKKSGVFNNINNKKDKIYPVNFDDFNFRVSLQNEEQMSAIKGTCAYIVNSLRHTIFTSTTCIRNTSSNITTTYTLTSSFSCVTFLSKITFILIIYRTITLGISINYCIWDSITRTKRILITTI